MSKLKFNHLRRFLEECGGATLIEYGVALIVAIIVGGVALSQLGFGVTESVNEAEVVMPNQGTAIDWQN